MEKNLLAWNMEKSSSISYHSLTVTLNILDLWYTIGYITCDAKMLTVSVSLAYTVYQTLFY